MALPEGFYDSDDDVPSYEELHIVKEGTSSTGYGTEFNGNQTTKLPVR